MALCPRLRRLALVTLALAGLAGCHAVDFYQPSLQRPVPPDMEPPRELSMVSLPAYQVEPPDILMIEMLQMVPLPPYRIEIYDVLQIRAVGALPRPADIDGFFLVEGEGIVTLGPAYGRVRVAGMTIEQASEAITAKLQELFVKPEVSVQLAKTAGTAPVTGEYLVGPDGTINLRQYGMLHVAGKTVTEIRQELNKHLAQYFDSPDASVEVRQFNSKVFYVITEGAGHGRQHSPRADHRQRHGHGRLQRGERFVAVVEHHDLGGASGAGRFRLRTDFAGRLRGDYPRRIDGDELSDHAGRSGVCGRGQHDRVEQLVDEDDRSDREDVRHDLVDHFDRPQLANPRPRIQPTAVLASLA